jgi:hypothetical protein
MATPSVQPAQVPQPSLPDLTVLAVPADHVLLFKARGRGVQIYPCAPSTHAFGPAHPRAILVTNDGDIIHHFKGPSWQAEDGSIVGTRWCTRFLHQPTMLFPGYCCPQPLLRADRPSVYCLMWTTSRVYTLYGNPPVRWMR